MPFDVNTIQVVVSREVINIASKEVQKALLHYLVVGVFRFYRSAGNCCAAV